jgi:hypothetical protein
MADQGHDPTAVQHSALAYKRYRHVKVVILGNGESDTPVERRIRMSLSIVTGQY